MKIARKILDRAMISKDARFDGKFFTGVKTTGIYCRPICPVPSPMIRNVEYFPTAAAAEENGYRPCLRCRPETTPGTPAWAGTSATVSRALKIISSSMIEDLNIDDLSEKLGISGRHLRRLFKKHIGASPMSVIKTHRLHTAKRLISDSHLSMAHIAFASGFNSVRNFNDTIRKVYGKNPSQLRKLSGGRSSKNNNPLISLTIPYQAPFHWKKILEFLDKRAIRGIECIKDDKYIRTISLADETGMISIRNNKKKNCIRTDIYFSEIKKLQIIIDRIRNIFDLDSQALEIERFLLKDSILSKAVQACPGIRVPGTWDGFEAGVRAIVGQQVSVKGAITILGRIADKYGRTRNNVPAEMPKELNRLFPEPGILAEANLENLGMTLSRIKTIKSFAHAVNIGEIRFDPWIPVEKTVNNLTSIKGIGDWTAEYIAMRALKNPDAFPAGDLVLRKAVSHNQKPVSIGEMEQIAEKWRPWRAYATIYLWTKNSIENKKL